MDNAWTAVAMRLIEESENWFCLARKLLT